MARYDYLNNYLNPNMNKFNNGGILTSYNVGGTHEESPHGGIPLGDDALVEQGEVSANLDQDGAPTEKPTGSKYIFSDRQVWTPEEVKAMGLPTTRKPVTAAEYMGKLNDKFKDRGGSKADKETFDTFTKRATQLAEQKRMQQEQLEQAMQLNSQQVAPENTEVPEGMEEYAEQPQSFGGGGGYESYFSQMNSMYGNASTDLNSASFLDSGSGSGLMDGAGDAAKGGLNNAGAYVKAAGTAFDLYNMAKGNTTNNKGKAIGAGALQGASAGMAFGPWGAAIGAVVGAGAGWIGAGQADKKMLAEAGRAGNAANAGMPNSSAWNGVATAPKGVVSAMGGYITSKPSKYGGGGPLGQELPPIVPKTFHTGNETRDKLLRTQDSLMQVARRPRVYVKPKEDIIMATPEQRAAQQKVKDFNSANAEAAFLLRAKQMNMTREQYSKHLDKIKKLPDVPYSANLKGCGPDGEGCAGSEAENARRLKKERNRAFGGHVYGGGGGTTDEALTDKLVALRNGNEGTITDSFLTNSLAGQFKASNFTPFSNVYGANSLQSIQAPQIGSSLPYQSAAPKTAATKDGEPNWFDRNKNDVARAYPIISNYIEREKIRKPTGTYSARLNDAYNVPAIDEARAMRDINAAYNNKYRALGQMGGSQAQQRAAMLGIGNQQNDAISQTETGLEALRNNRAMQEQQFKSQIAQYNAGKNDYDKEVYDKDIANYDTQRSKFTAQIGNDIGQVALEQDRMDQVAEMYGYTRQGKYLISKKTGKPATPEELSQLRAGILQANTTTTTPATSAYGGFINRKFR